MKIEKAHTSKLRTFSGKGYYVRLANKFLKDFKETFDKENVPEEVTAAYDAICDGKEIESIDTDYDNDYRSGNGYTVHWHEEYQFFACWEDCDYYVLNYYFFKNVWYEQYYCGQRHTGPDYASIKTTIYKQKGPLRYFCTQRPPSPGGIPDGYVTYEEYPFSKDKNGHWCPGEVTYNEPLTSEQCNRHGLRLDESWTEERSSWLKYYD